MQPQATVKMTDNPSEGGPPRQPAAIPSARHPGHELPFVTPSTYLQLRAPVAPRPTASSHTEFPLAAMALPADKLMTNLDREQLQGLVSFPSLPSGRGTCPARASFPFTISCAA